MDFSSATPIPGGDFPLEIGEPTATPFPLSDLPSETGAATATPLPVTDVPPAGVNLVNGFNLSAIPADTRPVVVAANPIENGAVIMPQDLTVYLILDSTLPEGSQFNIADILYKIAAVNISCGQILTLDYGVVNARDVAENQPTPEAEGCINIARTYRPGAGGVSRDYDGALYPLPYGELVDVYVFAAGLEAGSIVSEANLVLTSEYPPVLVPPTAVTDLESIVGQALAAPVVAGQLAVTYILADE